MHGISKHFGSLLALDQVDFFAVPGEIHALVGENGAGKTTLMRVLYGALSSDSGTYHIHGQSQNFANPQAAIAAGIGMVSQHFSIIPDLSVLQNLILGAEPGELIRQNQIETRAHELASQMGFTFQWNQKAGELSPSQGQKLEILKLLWREARVLILDEPTSMLAPSDADHLYARLRELAESGATVIVVTHRLPEVMDHADRVTILRGGKLIASLPVAETDAHQIATHMVGHAVPRFVRPPVTPGKTILAATKLSVVTEGLTAVEDVTFQLKAGELVGIAGVDGNGQRELFQAVLGVIPAHGTIELDGQIISDQPTSNRIAQGLRYIAEDRHHEAVILDWSIVDNAALGLHRLPPLAKRGRIQTESKAELASRATTTFPTKFDRLDQPIRDLSGGNQQKIVVARALALNPRVVLAFQPTRGVDLYAASLIYLKLVEFVRAGGSALVVGFDLDELIEHCDRLMVLHRGQLLDVPEAQRGDRQAIGRLMVGAL